MINRLIVNQKKQAYKPGSVPLRVFIINLGRLLLSDSIALYPPTRTSRPQTSVYMSLLPAV